MSNLGPKPKPHIERFNRYVKRSDGCWEWTGGKTRGRGMFNLCTPVRKQVTAARFLYEFIYGHVPAGTKFLHRCDNPACVRPDHIFLGTQSDNMRDKAMKGRAGKKLTKEDAYAILWRAASGEERNGLAAEYNVDRSTVDKIACRRTWPSLSEIHD